MENFWMIVECIFTNVWAMFKAIEIPGTNLSIAEVSIGALALVCSLRIFKFLIGIGPGPLDTPKASSGSLPKVAPGHVDGYLPKGR